MFIVSGVGLTIVRRLQMKDNLVSPWIPAVTVTGHSPMTILTALPTACQMVAIGHCAQMENTTHSHPTKDAR